MMASSSEPARLKRTLGLWDLIMIGIVIIQPIAPMASSESSATKPEDTQSRRF
jgi:hypothetical protein